MALCIDSTNADYITLATNALNTLAGGVANALTYTTQSYRVGDRSVVRVTEGPNILNAQAVKQHSVTLIQRIIASPHWVRIVQSHRMTVVPINGSKTKPGAGSRA